MPKGVAHITIAEAVDGVLDLADLAAQCHRDTPLKDLAEEIGVDVATMKLELERQARAIHTVRDAFERGIFNELRRRRATPKKKRVSAARKRKTVVA